MDEDEEFSEPNSSEPEPNDDFSSSEDDERAAAAKKPAASLGRKVKLPKSTDGYTADVVINKALALDKEVATNMGNLIKVCL